MLTHAYDEVNTLRLQPGKQRCTWVSSIQQTHALRQVFLLSPSHASSVKLLVDAFMIRQVQKSAISCQQLVSMIAVVVDFLIKIIPDDIVELQERFGCQFSPRPAEATLGDSQEVELFILRLLEEAIHLPLQAALTHS